MIHERNIAVSMPIVARALTNNATATANIDCRGYGYATIVVNVNSEANTNAVGPTITLSQADDTEVTSFATVTANITGDAVAAKPIVYGVDLRGKKRYLRLSVSTGTATNDHHVIGATAILSRPSRGLSGTTGVAATTGVTRFL